jgi:hypothetical protein
MGDWDCCSNLTLGCTVTAGVGAIVLAVSVDTRPFRHHLHHISNEVLKGDSTAAGMCREHSKRVTRWEAYENGVVC